MSGENTPTTPPGDGSGAGSPDGAKPDDAPAKTFTQDEVNQIIGRTRTEERRKASEKYADYDDLKKAADGKKTSDDRLAELENKYAQSEANALRLRVAGDYGVPTKSGEDGQPSDAELFLTGTDEETLVYQAKRYAQLEEQRTSKQQNRAPREGNNPPAETSDMREFARQLFKTNE